MCKGPLAPYGSGEVTRAATRPQGRITSLRGGEEAESGTGDAGSRLHEGDKEYSKYESIIK